MRERLDRLEKRIVTDPIQLRMPNGVTERLTGHPNYVLDLMMRSLNGEQVPEMNLISQSISSEEPGGSRMVDMARLLHAAKKNLLNTGPVQPRE